MDQITLDRIKLLHPQVRQSALDVYGEICCALKGRAMCRFTYTLRTFKEQDALYALGRTVVNPDGKSKIKPKGNIVTNAKAGQSYHNFSLAFDIALVIDTNKDGKFDTGSWDTKGDYDGDLKSDWMECVTICKAHGWAWGGDFVSFPDKPHFEKRFGYHWKTLLDKHNKKDYIKDTTYVNL